MVRFRIFILVSILMILTVGISSISYAAYTSPYAEPTSLVRYGNTGIGVKWVQDMLRQNGYSLTIDGAFGPQTQNAVILFQKENSLEVDGIVGALTRSALKKELGSASTTTTTNSSTTTVNAYRYASANVNFRNGPSTGNTSYGILAKGTEVYVYQNRSDGWSYVKYNNRYGYINTTYLQVTKPVTTTTSNTSTNTTTTNTSLPAFSRNAKDLLTIIKNCKSYYANNNFNYSLADGVRSIPADKSKSYSGKYYVDCSAFTTWVLYEYANANGKTAMKNYFSYQRNSATFASIGANGGNDYLQVVNGGLANAKPGDILVTQGHVEFFSSYTQNANGTISMKVYNCGSDGSIKVAGISNSATKNASEIKYILRVK
ncbi:MAG: peptidoglycan-binding protein [Clostridia bacterium]|nr:peptidoglycan-binding protein [Clostridia bacterium]